MSIFAEQSQETTAKSDIFAEIAQSVEHQLPKLRAAGSNPVFRSNQKTGHTFAM